MVSEALNRVDMEGTVVRFGVRSLGRLGPGPVLSPGLVGERIERPTNAARRSMQIDRTVIDVNLVE